MGKIIVENRIADNIGADHSRFLFRKNQWESVAMAYRIFKGKEYIDIRQFYDSPRANDSRLIPSKKGLSFPLDRFWDFLKCVEELRNFLVSNEIIQCPKTDKS